MKPSEYWAKRSEEVAARQFAKADAYQKELAREYARATEEIRRSIEVFYQRYAENGQVSMAEARRQLSGNELKRFKMTLEEFIQKAKNNADGRWTKQLNEVYYRVRVSRYEALLTEIQQHVEMLAGSRQAGARELLSDVYEDTYYRTIYEIQRGTGFGVTFAKVDQGALEKVLGTQCAGSNWSKRIWGDRDKLVTELRTKLAQAFIRGDSVDRTARDLADRMRVSYSNAERLVQTETAFFVGEATAAGYKASGVVDQYEFLATLDNRTSDICRSMDGRVFKLSEREVGVNYPPLHARCRSTVVPYFDDEIDVGERVARNEDGEVYYVPGNIKYDEWKKRYVDSSKPPANAIINKNNYRRFSSEKDVKDWEQFVTPQWLESLTDEEKNAIYRYTGTAYFDINRNLRAGGGDERYDELARLISSGIAKFNLLENITVYRGLEKNIFGVSAEKLPGAIFKESAFMSTSMLEGKQFSGYVQMEIRVPAGSKGALINPLSDFKDREYEFLLDHGTKFKILEAEEKNGKLKLLVEVMNDDD